MSFNVYLQDVADCEAELRANLVWTEADVGEEILLALSSVRESNLERFVKT